MRAPETLAIIGSGPSALYLLHHVFIHLSELKGRFDRILIFEKGGMTGMGMPYNPDTTDRFNLSNISSEELPALPTSFADWLRAQTPSLLASWGITPGRISEEGIYSRVALGQYFKAQYQLLTAWIAEEGIIVEEHAGSPVSDIRDDGKSRRAILFAGAGLVYEADKVVIATGHHWPDKDEPRCGYYASPWPIQKILPPEDGRHAFTIGTLGASLSAFDVISSLAHRHGDFVFKGGRMVYSPHPGTEGFKIVMHSAHGLLPHLQFDQVNPMRDIYRHVKREGIVALLDADGFLRIERYFDVVCRPVLRRAFEQDGMGDMCRKLDDEAFGLVDFVETMSDKHDYDDAFEGMRKEMVEAERSVGQHKPIHWKEAVDDLMYALNYHAELLPAEDHLLLQGKVMPFLLNVIAAMPLPSGHTILALHDAGRLEMASGRVVKVRKLKSRGITSVIVEQNGQETSFNYRMFIDCSGQKPVSLKDYPFPSLIRARRVRKARAPFLRSAQRENAPEEKQPRMERRGGRWFFETGGIDIDAAYRLIGANGRPNARIHDIAFPHTSGHRPYSYGLQACHHTSAMVVQSWINEMNGAPSPS